MVPFAENVDKGRPERVVLLHVVVIARQDHDNAVEAGQNLRRLANETLRDARGVEKIPRNDKNAALAGIRQIDHGSQGLEPLIDELLLQGGRIAAAGELEPEMQVGSVKETDHGWTESSERGRRRKCLSVKEATITPGVGQ